jgi:microcystin degradation protein MlrC
MRIAIGYLTQESNTFSPLLTTLDNFQLSWGGSAGDAMRGTRTEIGGFLEVLAAAGVETVPMFAGHAVTSGPIRSAEFARLRHMVAEEVRRSLPADAILLALHGAMCAEDVDDCEGDLLTAIRGICGPDLPLVLTLDLHANVTQAIISQVNALVGYKTWPHIDHAETGQAAARMLLSIVAGEIQPVTVMQKMPMIVPAENMHTSHGPMAEVFAHGERFRREHPEILSVSVFGVQPWMDIPEMGCATVCVVNRDAELGAKCAKSMGRRFWDLRDSFEVQLTPLTEAVDSALHIDGQPVILAESSDSPTAGSPGDSADLLREILARAPGVPAAVWICDPAATAEAFRHPPGTVLEFSVGGAFDKVNRRALRVRATVKRTSDGEFILTGPFKTGVRQNMGRAAVLEVGSVEVLISERPMQNISVDLFRSQGIEPKTKKLVVVKSAGGFRVEYEPFAAAILMVDTPGVSSANLRRMHYARIPRPMYPFDLMAVQPCISDINNE